MGEAIAGQGLSQRQLVLGKQALGELGAVLAQPGGSPADEGVFDLGLPGSSNGLRRPKQAAGPGYRQTDDGAEQFGAVGRHQDAGRVQVSLADQAHGVGDPIAALLLGDVLEDQAERRLQLAWPRRRDDRRCSHGRPLAP